jgi:hypothetical protein
VVVRIEPFLAGERYLWCRGHACSIRLECPPLSATLFPIIGLS